MSSHHSGSFRPMLASPGALAPCVFSHFSRAMPVSQPAASSVGTLGRARHVAWTRELVEMQAPMSLSLSLPYASSEPALVNDLSRACHQHLEKKIFNCGSLRVGSRSPGPMHSLAPRTCHGFVQGPAHTHVTDLTRMCREPCVENLLLRTRSRRIETNNL